MDWLAYRPGRRRASDHGAGCDRNVEVEQLACAVGDGVVVLKQTAADRRDVNRNVDRGCVRRSNGEQGKGQGPKNRDDSKL